MQLEGDFLGLHGRSLEQGQSDQNGGCHCTLNEIALFQGYSSRLSEPIIVGNAALTGPPSSQAKQIMEMVSEGKFLFIDIIISILRLLKEKVFHRRASPVVR